MMNQDYLLLIPVLGAMCTFSIFGYGIYVTSQWSRINKAIQDFEHGVTEAKMLNLIELIRQAKRIPNRPVIWDTMRASFELVEQSKDVSFETKKRYRNFLLSLGVSRLKNVS